MAIWNDNPRSSLGTYLAMIQYYCLKFKLTVSAVRNIFLFHVEAGWKGSYRTIWKSHGCSLLSSSGFQDVALKTYFQGPCSISIQSSRWEKERVGESPPPTSLSISTKFSLSFSLFCQKLITWPQGSSENTVPRLGSTAALTKVWWEDKVKVERATIRHCFVSWLLGISLPYSVLYLDRHNGSWSA